MLLRSEPLILKPLTENYAWLDYNAFNFTFFNPAELMKYGKMILPRVDNQAGLPENVTFIVLYAT
jgi:hypothetical protein